ncbi:hypothetical protein B9L23_07970 [Parageobacillus galactosidasius]|uniref:Uncharacterized protein n=1 Tax=Parageobacillus galactosidasius TaxID=883812 RepID=A0A226QTQ3_9BACL|nr:hypothetical protein B9L23_07970 [Parageobacillus galactosidasius]
MARIGLICVPLVRQQVKTQVVHASKEMPLSMDVSPFPPISPLYPLLYRVMGAITTFQNNETQYKKL